jgi:hypothetical protein
MNAGRRDLSRWRWRFAALGVVAAFATLVQSAAVADPTLVGMPVIPGAPPPPGPLADPGKPSEDTTVLKTTPDIATAGSKITFSATGLPAGKDVSLVWMTANVRYILDPKPDSVDYIGRKVDKVGVELATTKTSASGTLNVTVTTPVDYGGLHDIYAVADGLQLAKGGFLLERTVKMSPTRGPVGTSITIKVVGMGSPTYESVGAVLYDNHYTGAVSANWTRGVSVFKLRAPGEIGPHWIEYAGSSHTVPYLNMEQSPVPWTDGHRLKFTVTGDAGPPKTRIEWPAAVKPTIDMRTAR